MPHPHCRCAHSSGKKLIKNEHHATLEAAVEKCNTMSSSAVAAWGAAGGEGDLTSYSSLSVASGRRKLK